MRSELSCAPVTLLASGFPASIRREWPSGVTNKVPPPPSTSIETICSASSFAPAAGENIAAVAKAMSDMDMDFMENPPQDEAKAYIARRDGNILYRAGQRGANFM